MLWPVVEGGRRWRRLANVWSTRRQPHPADPEPSVAAMRERSFPLDAVTNH